MIISEIMKRMLIKLQSENNLIGKFVTVHFNSSTSSLLPSSSLFRMFIIVHSSSFNNSHLTIMIKFNFGYGGLWRKKTRDTFTIVISSRRSLFTLLILSKVRIIEISMVFGRLIRTRISSSFLYCGYYGEQATQENHCNELGRGEG